MTIIPIDACYRLITDPKLLHFYPTLLLPLQFRFGPLSPEALAELKTRITTGRAPISSASSVISHILSVPNLPEPCLRRLHRIPWINSLSLPFILTPPNQTTVQLTDNPATYSLPLPTSNSISSTIPYPSYRPTTFP